MNSRKNAAGNINYKEVAVTFCAPARAVWDAKICLGIPKLQAAWYNYHRIGLFLLAMTKRS